MNKKIKFVLNRHGVGELLKSDTMKDICKEYADKARSSLGDGYEVSTFTGKNRVNAEIYAATVLARQENAKNNTILKAVGKVNDN